MRRRFALGCAIAILASCTGGPAAKSPSSNAPPKKVGANLLAWPGHGAGFVVAGAPQEVVRGRTRWHLDADGGATRARVVTKDAITTAVRVPDRLGGGVALLGDGGLYLAATSGDAVKPITRGALRGLSIGSTELWARARGLEDWVRISLGDGDPIATYEAPPIRAPIAATHGAAWTGALLGRGVTAGPELVSAKVGFAIVDLLGPIETTDGGDTWSPLDRDAVTAAFPPPLHPTRLLRDANGVSLATPEDGGARIVPISIGGKLGAPLTIATGDEAAPEIASIRLESIAIDGVTLDDGNVLVADAGKLAIASLDPVRVLRVSKDADLTRCELRAPPRGAKGDPSRKVLAVAACVRHDAGPTAAGMQLVAGVVVEGLGGPHVVPERVFSFPTTYAFSSDGALVVTGACAGGDHGALDLHYAPRACVRDRDGAWHDENLDGITERAGVAPMLDGGLLIAKHDGPSLDLLRVPPDATATTIPDRTFLPAGPPPISTALVSIDEVESGKVVIWRTIDKKLEGATIEAREGTLRVVKRSPSTIGKDAGTFFGVSGAKGMAIHVEEANTPKAAITSFLVTTDAGATWTRGSWPASAAPLEASSIFDCGALGCAGFGWTRLGWETSIASADDVRDLTAAHELTGLIDPPARSVSIAATCTSESPVAPFDPGKVPTTVGAFYFSSNPKDALLGGAQPKVGAGQWLQITPFNRGATRGGVISWGPSTGGWGDAARTFIRFSSDLDPIGSAFETPPIASPYSDRLQAARGVGSTFAYVLAPGRILVAMCELGHCTHVFRVTAGAPIESIDLSSVGDVQQISNARELGASLLVVGKVVPHDASAASVGKASEPLPFVAVVGSNGVVARTLARAGEGEDFSLLAAVDSSRGRFGLALYAPLPSWTGGATYVLPIDAATKPTGAFEALVPAPTELAHPADPCVASASGWDRGEQNRHRVLSLAIDGAAPIEISGDGTTIRERLSSSNACLERLTLVGPRSAFQLDAETGKALYLALDDAPSKGPGATKHALKCTVKWAP